MRPICFFVVAIVAFSDLGSAQAFISGNLPNLDILQIGYVVVRTSQPSTTGLLAFEEITQRTGENVFQSTALPAPPVTNTALIVTSHGLAGERTGIAIVNTGGFSANVTLTLRNHEGLIVTTRTMVLQGQEQVADFLSGFFGSEPLGLTGLLSISSSQPVGVAAFIFRGSDFAESPTTVQAGLTDPAFDPQALLFPHWAFGAGWSTRIVISNNTFLLQTLRVDFYNSVGVLLVSVPNVNVPGGGVTVISPAVVE